MRWISKIKINVFLTIKKNMQKQKNGGQKNDLLFSQIKKHKLDLFKNIFLLSSLFKIRFPKNINVLFIKEKTTNLQFFSMLPHMCDHSLLFSLFFSSVAGS